MDNRRPITNYRSNSSNAAALILAKEGIKKHERFR